MPLKSVLRFSVLSAPSTRLLLMLGFVSFSVTLSVFRAVATDSPHFLFLNWNLLLAVIPYLISRQLRKRRHSISPFIYAGLLAVWLLFFPNAPYILTDLFHLKKAAGMPLWYDLILLLSYAWIGLLFGLMSLQDIEYLSEERFGAVKSRYLLVVLMFLASFGVYVGRFLRWNSWDIIRSPKGLLHDLAIRFLYPFEHPSTWGMTLLLGCLLNMVYFSLKYLRSEPLSR